MFLFQEQCAELLEIISDRINSRNPNFTSHLLLSIFKMAEVEIVQIEPSLTAAPYLVAHHLLVSTFLLIRMVERVLTTPS